MVFPLRRKLDNTLCQHGIGYFNEAADIGTIHIIDVSVGFGPPIHTGLVDILHDILQSAVHFFSRPWKPHAVLGHF